jgi:hypothetical protein
MARYICTQRPYPGVHVVSPICNVYVTFDQEGVLDTAEAGSLAGIPHELIDEAVEQAPAFAGEGRTIFREGEAVALGSDDDGNGDGNGSGQD